MTEERRHQARSDQHERGHAGGPTGGRRSGGPEPVDIQVEMQRSYIDYAMSVIVGAGAARRPGRAQAGARARPVRDVRRRVPAGPGLLEVLPGRRRRDGPVPPARRLGDLRRAGPPRPALVDADAAGRRAGQLRLAGQRPAAAMRYTECRLARWRWRCCGTSTRTPSISARTTTAGPRAGRAPGRFPNLLVNGSEGIAVGMATKIPPHNLREVARGAVVPGELRRRPTRSCSPR